MKRLYVVALAALVAGFGARVAEGASYTHAKMALHLTHPPAKNTVTTICQTESPVTLNIPCSAYVVNGATGASYSLYVVVAGADSSDVEEALGDGIKGVTFGISYNGTGSQGVDVTGWTSCADLEFPNDWPNSGGGNVLTWVDCHVGYVPPNGAHIVVGAFAIYAYSADQFSITPNNKLGVPDLSAADCGDGAQWPILPENAGRVSFDALNLGCNPCLTPCAPVPVIPATWGRIKNLYYPH